MTANATFFFRKVVYGFEGSWLVFGEHVVGFNLSMVQVSSLQIALGHLFLLVTIGGSARNGNKTTVSEEMRFPVF